MTESVSVRYTGSVPGADSNTYPIFNSVTDEKARAQCPV